jgi:DNA invertase Pin-like site-specific DNA recombinase
MPKSRKKTCVCYLRTSSRRQKDEKTIEVQRDICARIVTANDLRLLDYSDGWIVDDGISGSQLEGRALQQFITDYSIGIVKPDYLVTYSHSRLARVDRVSKDQNTQLQSAISAATIQALLHHGGIEILDETGAIKPGSVIYDLKASLSNEEYKLIRDRTLNGKAKWASEGYWVVGGRPPYGYIKSGKNKRGKLVRDDVHAANLIKILNWYLEGGARRAAKKATEAMIEVPTAANPARKNRMPGWTPYTWDSTSVDHIARNVRIYLGQKICTIEGVSYTLQYEPLIAEEFCAQVELKYHTRILKNATQFATTGYVDCACGRHLYHELNHHRHYLTCLNRCGFMHVEEFDDHFWKAILIRLAQITTSEVAADNNKSLEEQLLKWKAELHSAENEINKLLDLHLNGLDREVWIVRNTAANTRKMQIKSEIARVIKAQEIAKSQSHTEQTLIEKLSILTEQIFHIEDLDVEKQRETLSSVLGSAIITAEFPPRIKGVLSSSVKLTFPAFRSLPAATIDSDDDSTIIIPIS